jgi:hypothetical protein
MPRVKTQILFREAVRDLAYAPTPENVRRYLLTSEVLDAGAGGRKPGRARRGPARSRT